MAAARQALEIRRRNYLQHGMATRLTFDIPIIRERISYLDVFVVAP